MAAKASKAAKPKMALTMPRASSTKDSVARLNRWREQYNPLRGLNIARAIQLLESYFRGEMADLQWTYYFIEQTDPDLFALIERRTSAMMDMDWEIEVVPAKKRNAAFDQKLADDQAAALRAAYEGITNLYEGIDHLAMASFRGFAHLEKMVNGAGEVTSLQVVDQWNVVRDGLRGAWRYNPDAQQTSFEALGADMDVAPENFLIRTTNRGHINRLGLIKFIRANLSEKDWDAFIEIYGIPSGVVTMPPNVPADKETEYEESAKEIAEGGSGAIPNGATYTPNDSARGTDPFKPRLDHLSEKLILAGTGGMLTMLTAPGSGTLAGNAHADTFQKIAKSEGRKISEVFQRQMDAEILADQFPGKPVLAYFKLCIESETDSSEVVKDVAELSRAGYQVDAAQISEKTGYKVTLKAAPAPEPLPGEPGKADPADPNQEVDPAQGGTLKNRATGTPLGLNEFAAAVSEDLRPIYKRLWAITEITDDAIFAQKAQAFLDELPALIADVNQDPAAAHALYRAMSTGLINGLAARKS